MGHGYIWAKTALCCCRRRRRRCLFYTVHVQNLSRSVASPLSQLQQEFSELLLLLVSSFYFVELYPRCHGVGSDLTSPWSLTEMLLYRDMSMALRLWSSVGKWLPCVWNERSMMMMITDCALFGRNCQIRVCVCVCVFGEGNPLIAFLHTSKRRIHEEYPKPTELFGLIDIDISQPRE